ncbi:MAG: CDP-glucose 4,6-dehydratase [Deltaproteobacteria bacterium]|nr:CDP-glucose 4,6-dehydratase [Deltaproteobacteria bacterium]
MSTLGDTFRGRSVLVTGHTGFKGSWLVAWLKRMGARVTGYALPAPPESETPSLFRAARLHEGITHVEGDLRDRAALSACVASAEPEVVLHLAAQSLVRHSYEEPVETFATNVLGTVHLLEACRPRPASSGGAWAGPRAVVVVTTDKCYENREWPWAYREVDALGGHDPYSASKACAELATAAYRGSFFGGANPVTRIASARAGNVIGGGDWAKDRILPDIVRATLAGTRARIRNPAAVRPWQHVLEPLAGYLLLAARLMEEGGASHARAWNFGPKDDEPVPVSRIATRFAAGLGHPADRALELMTPDPKAPKETHLLRVDSTQARVQLGWRPLLSVDEAVDWTAAWYRAWLDDPGAAAKALAQQLASYDERLTTP